MRLIVVAIVVTKILRKLVQQQMKINNYQKKNSIRFAICPSIPKISSKRRGIEVEEKRVSKNIIKGCMKVERKDKAKIKNGMNFTSKNRRKCLKVVNKNNNHNSN